MLALQAGQIAVYLGEHRQESVAAQQSSTLFLLSLFVAWKQAHRMGFNEQWVGIDEAQGRLGGKILDCHPLTIFSYNTWVPSKEETIQKRKETMKLSNAASKASIHRGSIGQDATTSTSTLVQEIGLYHLTSMNANGDITAFESCILTLLETEDLTPAVCFDGDTFRLDYVISAVNSHFAGQHRFYKVVPEDNPSANFGNLSNKDPR